MIDENWKPLLNSSIATQSVGDELLLLDKNSRRVHQLDRVGTSILSCCDGSMSVEDIIRKLLDQFDVSRKQLDEDVPALLERLRVFNILL